MLDVRNIRRRGAVEELHAAMAIFAAEGGIAILNSFRNGFHLPEKFVSTGGAYSTALYFTLG